MKYGLSFLLVLGAFLLQAQEYHWIVFTDKADSPFSLNSPEEYLSERAIERRLNQNIPLALNDLPVSPTYVDSINSLDSVNVRFVSKWFNAVSVEVPDNYDLSHLWIYC